MKRLLLLLLITLSLFQVDATNLAYDNVTYFKVLVVPDSAKTINKKTKIKELDWIALAMILLAMTNYLLIVAFLLELFTFPIALNIILGLSILLGLLAMLQAMSFFKTKLTYKAYCTIFTLVAALLGILLFIVF